MDKLKGNGMRNRLLVQALFVMAFGTGAIQTAVARGDMQDGAVPGTPFARKTIQDDSGRSITYYISRPRAGTAPILLMVQGSGCARVLNKQAGAAYSTIFNLVPFASDGRFTVVAVEKPFSGEETTDSSGTATACSRQFNEDFTAEGWLKALQAGLADARRSPWADQQRTLVLGMSEGAVMATMLAASDKRVTDVIAISGSGTTQLYDFFAQAYRTCFDVSRCLAALESTARDISADPHSSTRFAWGHPHKRWTSFFRVDPGEQLLRSRARIYLALGTSDSAVPALSQEVAVAKLLGAGRDLTVKRVADGDHSLRPGGASTLDTLDAVQRTALDWFVQAK
ncbi:alpha/beta hydrolase family protein [Massilia soli]|uniref:Peptidase S9 prolyl oligopeptidase catalytic domain-containing protein n=1 Tax=Massilia soli TaxID=2792854 RepID=A0ABS7STU0_9BURK|nr:hypothetical protein [Massilia soli]MBZ2209342.1 hypothetical protein [Massilia soli]